jgi:hypothetical protein
MAVSVEELGRMNMSVVDRALFDEAIRVGEQSATHANRSMRINRVAVDAIADALELIKSGRIGHARERLSKALLVITKMSKPR